MLWLGHKEHLNKIKNSIQDFGFLTVYLRQVYLLHSYVRHASFHQLFRTLKLKKCFYVLFQAVTSLHFNQGFQLPVSQHTHTTNTYLPAATTSFCIYELRFHNSATNGCTVNFHETNNTRNENKYYRLYTYGVCL